MATKTLLVTLKLTVADLSAEQREDIQLSIVGADEEGEEDEETLPVLSDYARDQSGADMVARVLGDDALIQDDILSELFAGSDLYVTFSAATVVKAEWVPAPDQEYADEAAKTRAAGESPCEGCGKPGVVVDINGCDLCQECADGCKIDEDA